VACAIAAAAALTAIAAAARHDALVIQARQAHESLTYELVMAFISLAVVLAVIVAVVGAAIRPYRNRRLRRCAAPPGDPQPELAAAHAGPAARPAGEPS
jgi:heme/copper-type cytochrome/quinol oxidase subunit 2